MCGERTSPPMVLMMMIPLFLLYSVRNMVVTPSSKILKGYRMWKNFGREK